MKKILMIILAVLFMFSLFSMNLRESGRGEARASDIQGLKGTWVLNERSDMYNIDNYYRMSINGSRFRLEFIGNSVNWKRPEVGVGNYPYTLFEGDIEGNRISGTVKYEYILGPEAERGFGCYKSFRKSFFISGDISEDGQSLEIVVKYDIAPNPISCKWEPSSKEDSLKLFRRR